MDSTESERDISLDIESDDCLSPGPQPPLRRKEFQSRSAESLLSPRLGNEWLGTYQNQPAGQQPGVPGKRPRPAIEDSPEDEDESPGPARKSRKKSSPRLSGWPEGPQRQAVSFAVREVCKWCLGESPLPGNAELGKKILLVWRTAVEKYPAAGFGELPGQREASYVSGHPAD